MEVYQSEIAKAAVFAKFPYVSKAQVVWDQNAGVVTVTLWNTKGEVLLHAARLENGLRVA